MSDNRWQNLDSLSAKAAAAELDRLRAEALARGVGIVTVGDLAERARELRDHAAVRDAVNEANLRAVMRADRQRNYGIGEQPC